MVAVVRAQCASSALAHVLILLGLLVPPSLGFLGPFCPVGLQAASMIPSSNLNATSGSASNGRLYGTGWTANSNSTSEYLQIDLGKLLTITGVATRGASSPWVTSFMLNTSMDGVVFNVSYTLSGNTDQSSVVNTLFIPPNNTGDMSNSTFFVNLTGPTNSSASLPSSLARYVRFIPLAGSGGTLPASLSVELYTPCVFAEFFGWQPGRGVQGGTITNPSPYWNMTRNTGAALTTDFNGNTAMSTLTGLNVTSVSNLNLAYLSSQRIDLSNLLWANLSAFMINSASSAPIVSIASFGGSSVSQLLAWSSGSQSPILNLNLTLRFMQPMVRFIRNTSAMSGSMLLQAVWIDGREKSCAQRPGIVVDLASGQCSSCNGVTEFQDQPGQSSCKPVQNCSLGVTFETGAPTASSDRVCSSCQSCGSGSYQATSCNLTSNTGCSSCLDGCVECTNGLSCARCALNDRYLSVDKTQCYTSPPGCPTQYFQNEYVESLDSFYFFCLPCNSPCNTCANDPDFCSSCNASMFLFDDTRDTCRSDCGPNLYGNVTTRLCTPLTVCSFPPQYQSSPPGISSDRVCSLITGCPAGQVRTQEPTPTSNRVCADCPAGTIDHDNNYNTSCLTCPAGTYTPPGTAGSSCPVCPAGTTDHDFNASTPCQVCNDPGLFVPANSTGSCSLYQCKAGTLDSDSNSSTPCTTCNPGFNLSAPGLFGPCSNHACPRGTTDLDNLTSTNCVRCPVGSFVPEQQFGSCAPFICLNGTTDADSNPATECVSCGDPGLFVPANSSGDCSLFTCQPGTLDGDSNSSTVCTTCPPGTNLSVSGLFGACSKYSCPAGTTNLNSNPASGCTRCGPGSYVPPASAGLCSLYQCLNGSTDDDSDSSTLCVNCTQPGLFVPANSTGVCSDGKFLCSVGSIDGDNRSSTPCTTCPPGTDLSTRGKFGSCNSQLCAAGQIDEDSDPATKCVACPRGGYVPPGRFGACSQFVCLNGTIDDDNSSRTPCVGCSAPGLFVPSNSSGDCSNFKCQVGTIDSDLNSSTVCTFCNPGTQLDTTGLSGNCSSFLCPFGTIDGDNNPATTCTWCPSGAFVPRGQSGSCSAFVCDFGFIDADRNASTPCAQCLVNVSGPGLFVPRNSSGSCSTFLCPVGTLDNDRNASTVCVTCNPGTNLNATGLSGPCEEHLCALGTSDTDSNPNTTCVTCPAGTFVPTGQFGPCDQFRCALGESDTDNRSSTQCVPCAQAGLFVPLGSFGDCAAYPCPVNTTDDDGNSATLCISCSPGTSLTTAGLFGLCSTHRCSAGTIDQDSDPATACVNCPAGSYVPPGSYGACAVFDCAAGSVDEDQQSSTPCTDCLSGSFQPLIGRTSCNACTLLCAGGVGGQYVSVSCNKTSDITCANCTTCATGFASTCTNFTDAVCAAPSSSSSGGTAVFAAAAGGGALLLILLILLVVFLKKKKSQTQPQRQPTEAQMILPRTNSLMPDMKLFEPRAADAAPQTYVMLKDIPTAKQSTLYALPSGLQSESDVDMVTQETVMNDHHQHYAEAVDVAPHPMGGAASAAQVAGLYTAVNKGPKGAQAAQPIYSAPVKVQGDESMYASAEREESAELLGPDGRPLYTAVQKNKRGGETLYEATDAGAAEAHYAAQSASFYAPLAEVKPEQPHPDGLIYSALDLRLPGAAQSPPPGSGDHVVYSAVDLRASGLSPAGASDYSNVADESHYANPDAERRPTLRKPEEI
eukprot:m.29661 g.29661  ORF g.29661 m.29661 type:complete len:1720 (-) comp9183_c1_seq2:38-5197(-)